MDGNRRWAKSQGRTSAVGHVAGYEKMKEVAEWAKEARVRTLVIYAFSSENWKRDTSEVAHLLSLIALLVKEFTEERAQGKHVGTQVRFVGDLSTFPLELAESMRGLEKATSTETERTIGVAVSYGGRAEIVGAARKMVEEGGDITEERFSDALWTSGMSDPDLIIRTGGEKRLSNFLPWQVVYSELFFIDTEWPAFSKEEFEAILVAFAARKRNFGA